MLVTEIFHDMTPIPQDDGPNPICQIDYPQEFDIAQSYLRAILQKKEHSERALQLTAYCLQFNPANYTTWWYRRQCLAALSSSSESINHFDHTRIVKDLMLASKLGGSNPKNYQIWFHRRNLLEHVTNSFIENEHEDGLHLIQEELEYIASVLLMDAKNYHAWSHRQWVISTTNSEKIYKEELQFIETLLQKDIRNNSAWNQRWFITHHASKSPLLFDTAQQELEYTIQKTKLDAYNESPWRYFIAIVKEQYMSMHDPTIRFDFINHVLELIQNVKLHFESETTRDWMTCIHLVAVWIDVLEIKGDEESIAMALDFICKLETVYDPIRKKYWKLRSSQLR